MREVEKFYEWMESINSNFLHDNDRMCQAFDIVSQSDVNDIEVIEPIIVTPN